MPHGDSGLKDRAISPFPKRRSVGSVRLRHLMDEVQRREIGERIRDLREESAETNRSIADYCGVGERTVAGWIAGAGISYKNAVKVGALFGADIDWLWRGRERGPAPDPFANPELAEIRELLGQLLAGQATIRAELQFLREAQTRTAPRSAPRKRRPATG